MNQTNSIDMPENVFKARLGIVSDVPDEAVFLQNSQEVAHMLDYINMTHLSEDYQTLFVLFSEFDEVVLVVGLSGLIPYLHSAVDVILDTYNRYRALTLQEHEQLIWGKLDKEAST